MDKKTNRIVFTKLIDATCIDELREGVVKWQALSDERKQRVIKFIKIFCMPYQSDNAGANALVKNSQ